MRETRTLHDDADGSLSPLSNQATPANVVAIGVDNEYGPVAKTAIPAEATTFFTYSLKYRHVGCQPDCMIIRILSCL